jgi:ABC-type bacteriocin/lantibiotic exporter with double-glycine peptidase domain
MNPDPHFPLSPSALNVTAAPASARSPATFELDMGIFKLKFTMHLFTHLQRVAGLLVGGWWVYTDRLEIGGVVAFLAGIARITDPWGDLVNYFRDLSVTQVKYRLLADAVDQLSSAEILATRAKS